MKIILRQFAAATRPLFMCSASACTTIKTVPFLDQNIKFFSDKGSKQWLRRHINDPYVKASKQMNYRSRAAFKLIEIDSKHSLLKPGMRVLEIGSAPGSWTQLITQKLDSTSENPLVVAVDLLDMKPVPGCIFVKGDISSPQTLSEIDKALGTTKKVDLVCSDAAPEFIGEKDSDHENTVDLNFIIVDACIKYLKEGGILLMKTMQGSVERKLKVRFNFILVSSC